MRKKDLRIAVGSNEEIHLHITYPSEQDISRKYPSVILSHGFTVDGTESHRMFLELAKRLSLEGLIAINFDYRGSGYSDGDFEDLTVTKEIEDLRAVVDYVTSMREVDKNRVAIIGQSLGSYVAILALHSDTRIRAFVSWGTPVNLYKLLCDYFGEKLQRNGIVCHEKGFYIKKQFLEDLREHDELSCVSSIEQPILFIHAQYDEWHPVEEVKKLFQRVKAPKTVVIIEGANHSFKCQRQLEKKAIDRTVEWLLDKFGMQIE